MASKLKRLYFRVFVPSKKIDDYPDIFLSILVFLWFFDIIQSSVSFRIEVALILFYINKWNVNHNAINIFLLLDYKVNISWVWKDIHWFSTKKTHKYRTKMGNSGHSALAWLRLEIRPFRFSISYLVPLSFFPIAYSTWL